MNQKLYYIIKQWLVSAGYFPNFQQLKVSLLSHPAEGNVLAITDTLTEYDIAHEAVSMPWQVVPQLTEPYFTYLQKDGRYQPVVAWPIQNNKVQLYVDQAAYVSVGLQEMERRWTGTVVVIEKRSVSPWMLLRSHKQLALYTGMAVLFISLYALSSSGTVEMLYFGLALAGLGMAKLITDHQSGSGEGLASQFCSLGKTTDCNSVLHSKAAKLTKHIGLSDVGITYFASQLLVLLLSAVQPDGFSILLLVSIVALPFIVYSLYQQKLVIQKWCPLCLGILGILFLQGVIAVVVLSSFRMQFPPVSAMIAVTVKIGLVTIAWCLLKPVLSASIAHGYLKIELQAFRRNHHLFLPYYQQQGKVDDSLLQTIPQIIIGNRNAPIQLTLITNPLCPACSRTHAVIDKLLQKWKTTVNLRIVFYVPVTNDKDQRTIVACWLTGKYLENPEKGAMIVSDWYRNPDVSRFNALKIPFDKNHLLILNQHSRWCRINGQDMTPVILLNNKAFPHFYKAENLDFFIEELLLLRVNEQPDVTNVEALKMMLASNI